MTMLGNESEDSSGSIEVFEEVFAVENRPNRGMALLSRQSTHFIELHWKIIWTNVYAVEVPRK